MRKPQNLPEMQAAIKLYERLLTEVPTKEESFLIITDQVFILDKYQIIIPEDVRQKKNSIPKEWAKYLEVLADAEKMLGYSKVLVKSFNKKQ